MRKAALRSGSSARACLVDCRGVVKGRRLTSDRPILECIDREQKELTSSGTVKRTLKPSLTVEEQARAEEQERRQAEERLRMFLEQYWGGPTTYSDERGHPRLRMRHATFHIASPQRDAWLACMRNAVHGLGLEKELEAEMLGYIEMAANSLVNQPD